LGCCCCCCCCAGGSGDGGGGCVAPTRLAACSQPIVTSKAPALETHSSITEGETAAHAPLVKPAAKLAAAAGSGRGGVVLTRALGLGQPAGLRCIATGVDGTGGGSAADDCWHKARPSIAIAALVHCRGSGTPASGTAASCPAVPPPLLPPGRLLIDAPTAGKVAPASLSAMPASTTANLRAASERLIHGNTASVALGDG
jgi:hypothetical protein